MAEGNSAVSPDFKHQPLRVLASDYQEPTFCTTQNVANHRQSAWSGTHASRQPNFSSRIPSLLRKESRRCERFHCWRCRPHLLSHIPQFAFILACYSGWHSGAHQAYSKQAVGSRSATHLAAEGMRCNDCPIYHSADK